MRSKGLIPALMLLVAMSPCRAAEPTLRLATLEYPPYIVNDAGGVQGLAVDVVRAVFARMKQPVTISLFPVSRGLHLLQSGEMDGFFSIKKTPEREKSLLFPRQALFRQDYVFFVRPHSAWNFDGDFRSLSGARIGVVRMTSFGSRFDAAAQAGRFGRVDWAASHIMNFRKLLAGRVDAVICSRLVGLYYLKQLNQPNGAVVSGPPVETVSSYLAFGRQKDFSGLALRFDQALESMALDGSLARLQSRYALPPATRSERVEPSLP